MYICVYILNTVPTLNVDFFCMTRSLFVVPVLNKLPSVEIFTKPVIILLGNLYETLKEDRYASGLNDPQSVDECWLLLDDLVS